MRQGSIKANFAEEGFSDYAKMSVTLLRPVGPFMGSFCLFIRCSYAALPQASMMATATWRPWKTGLLKIKPYVRTRTMKEVHSIKGHHDLSNQT